MAGTGFWWILLACAAYGAMHSLLASRTVKRAAARVLGEETYGRFYRLFFSAVGAITALPLLALAGLLPDRTLYTIPMPWRALTLLLQALAALALALGVMQTGAMRFIGLAQAFGPHRQLGSGAEPEKLIASGLYRWVRHPLYTASFVLLWLVPVMTWNLLALAIGLSVYLLVGTFFEEQKLVDQFGEAYREYRRKTPRIVPGFRPGGK